MRYGRLSRVLGLGCSLAACGARSEIDPGETRRVAKALDAATSADASFDAVPVEATIDAPQEAAAPDATLRIDAAPPPATSCVLLGGDVRGGDSETWTWDGHAWTDASPSPSPGPRDAPAVATLNGQVVVFGGSVLAASEFRSLAETWAWDGTRWTEARPVRSPAAREGAAAATFDGRVVLFGGGGDNGPLGDTWLYDGASWTMASPPTSPSARSGHALASFGHAVLLFGGLRPGSPAPIALADTWAWDGTTWNELHPTRSPPARFGAVLATVGDHVLLFGGSNVVGGAENYLGDTWLWDGANWSEVKPPTSPGARGFAGVGVIGDSLMLFGGVQLSDDSQLGDTWTWDGMTWTQRVIFEPSAAQSLGALGCY